MKAFLFKINNNKGKENETVVLQGNIYPTLKAELSERRKIMREIYNIEFVSLRQINMIYFS